MKTEMQNEKYGHYSKVDAVIDSRHFIQIINTQ